MLTIHRSRRSRTAYRSFERKQLATE